MSPEECAPQAKDATEYFSHPGRLVYLLGGITLNLLSAFLLAWLALALAVDEDDGGERLGRGPLTAASLVVDATQFELQHHSLRYALQPANADSAR